MKRIRNGKWLWMPALLLVLAVSFFVHAVPASLPSVPEREREYFRDETGRAYLTEMDSYFYGRLAREMTEAGRTEMYNRRDEDPLMSQRPVAQQDQGLPVLLSALAYWVWKVLSIFGRADIEGIIRWMGPVLGSLAAVPAFLYVRRRTNLAGGVAAGLLTGLSLPFLSHTHAGFFDTDMLLCVLPLGFLLLELRAMQMERLRDQVIAGAGSALLLALLSLTWWAFYMFFWLMVLGGLIGVLLVMAFAGRCPFRRRLLTVRGWLLSILPALLLVFVFRGTPGLASLGSVMDTFRSVSGTVDAFPYGWQFIGEMQALPYLPDMGREGIFSLVKAELGSGIGSLGGILPCLFALAALPLGIILSRHRKNVPDAPERTDRRIAALTELAMLLLWLGFGVVLMKSRRRFTEIAVLPAAVLAGLGVGFVVRLLEGRKARIRIPAAAVLSLGICVPMFLGSWAVAWNEKPSATDSISNAMTYIRETQPEDAVIGSWWDYGYFMQYASRRRVIFDGGYTGGDGFYLLGHALLTDDPAQMTGIFRMLETAGVSMISDLTRAGATQAEAAEYLLRIAGMSRAEAEQTTPPGQMTGEQFDALLDKTHPREERPLLLVMSDDMISKLSAIAHYALWDMEAMAPAGEVSWAVCARSEMLEPGDMVSFETEDRAVRMIAQMDDEGKIQGYPSVDGNFTVLSRLCVWKDGVKMQDTGTGGNGMAAVLVKEDDRYACFFCSVNLCDSMLVRLFICRDRTIPRIRLLGTWENHTENEDPCSAQRRISPAGYAGQVVQIWEADEY